MSSSDDAFAQIQAGGGGNFDMVSASNDLTQRLVDAGAVQAIDPTKLTNYENLYEQFKQPDYLYFDEKLYGVNFTWGPTLMLYNTDVVTSAPTSWRALLDPQYTGKIATWNAPIQIAQYALLLDPVPEDPYRPHRRAARQVKDLLIQQRPLLRTVLELRRRAGRPLRRRRGGRSRTRGRTRPWGPRRAAPRSRRRGRPEGVTGWSDSWMLTTERQNVDLAYKWMDYMIGPDGADGSPQEQQLRDHEQDRDRGPRRRAPDLRSTWTTSRPGTGRS
jgi:spermidine/putrescine-binding protein